MREQGAAEDIVQDAFLALWRKSGQYDERFASLRTWFLTIVRNRAIDVLRSGRRQRMDLPLLEEIEETAGEGARTEMAEGVEEALLRERVREVVAGLPLEQRRTVELIYFGGYTYEEAARLTDAPLGTVKSRLRSAFQKLRPLLASERGAS
jgi:RNA polymerase sigma-70 factor (ECF subfamily)